MSSALVRALKKRSTKTDRWLVMSERKLRAARNLARRIIWYFGKDEIERFLDGDIALRDQALALLGQPEAGGAEIPMKIWKRIFPKRGGRLSWSVQ